MVSASSAQAADRGVAARIASQMTPANLRMRRSLRRSALERCDLEESLDPFPVALHQRLIDEGAGWQLLAFEAAMQVGDEGPERDIGASSATEGSPAMVWP